MSMTVGDMLTLLEGYEEDTPLMFAQQPSWPLVSEIKGVIEFDDSDTENIIETQGKVVYILEGTHVGYGNEGWWHI